MIDAVVSHYFAIFVQTEKNISCMADIFNQYKTFRFDTSSLLKHVEIKQRYKKNQHFFSIIEYHSVSILFLFFNCNQEFEIWLARQGRLKEFRNNFVLEKISETQRYQSRSRILHAAKKQTKQIGLYQFIKYMAFSLFFIHVCIE